MSHALREPQEDGTYFMLRVFDCAREKQSKKADFPASLIWSFRRDRRFDLQASGGFHDCGQEGISHLGLWALKHVLRLPPLHLACRIPDRLPDSEVVGHLPALQCNAERAHRPNSGLQPGLRR